MTEKEPVIIDGVDVSGCEDYGYRGNAGYWCHNYDEPCTDYPNCNFKQLARKTQECEKLKTQLTSLSYADTICALEIDLEHKTKECARLQKTQFCFAYEKDCHKVCKQQNCIIKNGYKAEQKLEQIKEMLKKCVKIHDDIIVNKSILQIIDEVN